MPPKDVKDMFDMARMAQILGVPSSYLTGQPVHATAGTAVPAVEAPIDPAVELYEKSITQGLAFLGNDPEFLNLSPELRMKLAMQYAAGLIQAKAYMEEYDETPAYDPYTTKFVKQAQSRSHRYQNAFVGTNTKTINVENLVSGENVQREDDRGEPFV